MLVYEKESKIAQKQLSFSESAASGMMFSHLVENHWTIFHVIKIQYEFGITSSKYP